MTVENPWFLAALIFALGAWALQSLASYLNLRAMKPQAPAGFEDLFDAERYQKSQDYHRAHTRVDLISGTLSLLLFLVFWLCGGFAWIAGVFAGFNWPDWLSALALLGTLMLVSQLISLPFSLYDTFVLEERFGFNKTTLATFFLDRLKGLVLTILIGAPLIALLLWLLKLSWFWLAAWGVLGGFSLLMAWLAPRFLMPLFNKFSPLEDEELEADIENLASKCEFPFAKVESVDGSKRSSKANAFFTGFGATRRIGLFDTLLEKHTKPEILAVLAHEIGHAKLGHVPKMLGSGILQLGLTCGLLQLVATNPQVLAAFGLQSDFVQSSPAIAFAIGLSVFGVLYTPIGLALGLLGNLLSRKHEYEADAYAAEAIGSAQPLIDGLKRLSADQLANLHPHPLVVFLEYSHPPLPHRVAALEKVDKNLS